MFGQWNEKTGAFDVNPTAAEAAAGYWSTIKGVATALGAIAVGWGLIANETTKAIDALLKYKLAKAFGVPKEATPDAQPTTSANGVILDAAFSTTRSMFALSRKFPTLGEALGVPSEKEVADDKKATKKADTDGVRLKKTTELEGADKEFNALYVKSESALTAHNAKVKALTESGAKAIKIAREIGDEEGALRRKALLTEALLEEDRKYAQHLKSLGAGGLAAAKAADAEALKIKETQISEQLKLDLALVTAKEKEVAQSKAMV